MASELKNLNGLIDKNKSKINEYFVIMLTRRIL